VRKTLLVIDWTICSCVRTEYADESPLHMRTTRRSIAAWVVNRRQPLPLAPDEFAWWRMAQMRPRTNRMTTMKSASPTPLLGP
jgi:hypothetical protein